MGSDQVKLAEVMKSSVQVRSVHVKVKSTLSQSQDQCKVRSRSDEVRCDQFRLDQRMSGYDRKWSDHIRSCQVNDSSGQLKSCQSMSVHDEISGGQVK